MSRLIICEKKKRNKPYTEFMYSPKNRSRLISRLQAVQYVKFCDVSLKNIPAPFWSLLQGLEGVRELDVYQMTFESPVHFFRYICALPALEALSISRSSIQVAEVDLAPLRPKAPFCIPFLDVGRLSPGIFQWFLKQDPVPPVHTFRIKLGLESTDTVMLRQFVETMDNQARPPLNFSSFTNIRSIYVEGYLHLGELPESQLFESLLATIFTQITSPLLEKVSLNFSLHIDETMFFFGFPTDVVLNLFKWGALPESLSGKYRENLRSLCLVIRGLPPYQRKNTEVSLREGPFAWLEDRNILSVGFL
ncbi:hypothetical protein C0991_004843 [Blastosporella zonata]|nr:hypothetical protein C0991_004843 [Blastosporella zonata]